MNWSDFGARYYLGNGGEPVFLSVDPISERFPWVSGYNYAENRVPNAVDLHGLQAVWSAAQASRDPKTAQFQKENPKTAAAIAAVPTIIAGEGLVAAGLRGGLSLATRLFTTTNLKKAAVGAGTTLLYEGGASLAINRDLSGIDFADVAIGGITGSFWKGVVGGSLIDLDTKGKFNSIGGVIGEEKLAGAIGLDVGAGIIGKTVELGLGGIGKALSKAGDSFAEGAESIAKRQDSVLPIIQKSNVGVRAVSGRHIVGGIKTTSANFSKTGQVFQSISDEVRDGLTPLLQKYGSQQQ